MVSPHSTATLGPPFSGVLAASSDALCSDTIISTVEKRTKECELLFGRERLLHTISDFPQRFQTDHVNYYRTVVRQNEWPHTDRDSDFATFLSEYLAAALAYVESAFVVLEKYPWTNNASASALLLLAHGVEALRGQFGKRSPTGLDARLDDCIASLEKELSTCLPKDEQEAAVHALCSPTAPQLSAEAALITEFHAFKSILPSEPTLDCLLAVSGEDEEVVWRFLRRHCRWSVAQLSFYYRHLETQAALLTTQQTRALQSTYRLSLLRLLDRTCPADQYRYILSLSKDATALNHLNLTLEPSFSFKGGPGLILGMLFKRGANLGSQAMITQSAISNHKWSMLRNPSIYA